MTDQPDFDITPEPDPMFAGQVRLALADPVPADVVARSHDLFAFASIDAELATLLAEESADLAAAGVRSSAVIVTLTFVTSAATIELEHDGDTLSGQLLPGVHAEIELLTPSGRTICVTSNSVGTFELPAVGPGSWCLVVRTGDQVARTPWFTL